MAALRAGSVSAIIVPVPAVAVLKREGYNEVSFVATWSNSRAMVTAPRSAHSRASAGSEEIRAERSIGVCVTPKKPRGTIGVIQQEWKSSI